MGKALRTRHSLIEAAVRQISGDGELRPETVAADAGVSEASFYAHFGSKDGALAAAFEVAIGAVDDVVLGELAPDRLTERGAVDSVAAAVEAAAVAFGRHAALLRVAAGRMGASRAVREAYRRSELAALERIQAILDQSDGRLRRDPGTAVALLAMFQGVANPLVLGDADARARYTEAVVALAVP